MRNRFYSPSLGRFMSEDPLGLAGGDVTLYRYVGNNPVMFVDPSGLLSDGANFAISLAGTAASLIASATPLGPLGGALAGGTTTYLLTKALGGDTREAKHNALIGAMGGLGGAWFGELGEAAAGVLRPGYGMLYGAFGGGILDAGLAGADDPIWGKPGKCK